MTNLESLIRLAERLGVEIDRNKIQTSAEVISAMADVLHVDGVLHVRYDGAGNVTID
jgi:hypothetical protein